MQATNSFLKNKVKIRMKQHTLLHASSAFAQIRVKTGVRQYTLSIINSTRLAPK